MAHGDLKSVGSKELCRFKSGRPHHFLLVLVQPVDFMSTSGPTTSSPTIWRLAINRFRGIEKLTWCPQPGLNIILGGGDAGKSTILDALALLLNPSSAAAISDSDFWKREAEPDGFEIEAVMSLPDSAGVHNQSKQSWPWGWDVLHGGETSPLKYSSWLDFCSTNRVMWASQRSCGSSTP